MNELKASVIICRYKSYNTGRTYGFVCRDRSEALKFMHSLIQEGFNCSQCTLRVDWFEEEDCINYLGFSLMEVAKNEK